MSLMIAILLNMISIIHATNDQAGWIKQKVTPPVLTMILTLLVFVVILISALRFMTSIRTPVQFADKSLVMNKEY